MLHQLETRADSVEEDQNMKHKEHLLATVNEYVKILSYHNTHHYVCLITNRVVYLYNDQTGIVFGFLCDEPVRI